MARRSSDRTTRLALLAVAGGLAAALAAVARRLSNDGSLPGRLSARGRFRRREADTYRCDCGAGYRVGGTGRHRVYWPDGAPESEPVLGDRCPSCDAPLPAGRDTAVV